LFFLINQKKYFLSDGVAMGLNPVFFRSKFLAIILAEVFLLSACSGGGSSSSSSNSCVGLVCIETVNVADAGNPPDADTGYGAVSDPYAIGKYEVSVGQYLVFLNAVAAITDKDAIRYLWNEDMEDPKSYVSAVGLIKRTGSGTSAQPYVYTEMVDSALGANSGKRAILNISWFSAARFANWLHNGATASASTETGAYTLNYATSGVFTKNADARWWIPSEDQWYKAAYYDPTKAGTNKYWKYPTRSDALPVAEAFPGGSNSANFDSPPALEGKRITPVGVYTGSMSYYGTYDQAGLMWEWNDTVYTDYDGKPITRGMRGGSWSLGMINVSKFGPRDYEPSYNDDDSGFRLATTRK
jgi:formylglycine-generating enzyme required for sulfatase activity